MSRSAWRCLATWLAIPGTLWTAIGAMFFAADHDVSPAYVLGWLGVMLLFASVIILLWKGRS